MRAIFPIAAIIGMASVIATEAKAQYDPWCSSDRRIGAENCGFVAYAQRRAYISGIGGFYYPKPYYAYAVPAPRFDRPYRGTLTAVYCVLPYQGTSPYLPIPSQEEATPKRAAFVDEVGPSFVDQPRRPRRSVRRAATPDGARTNRLAARSEPERYSDKWWEMQERADDKLKPKLIICRGC
jgi:Protein of unknown function (DUF3551)